MKFLLITQPITGTSKEFNLTTAPKSEKEITEFVEAHILELNIDLDLSVSLFKLFNVETKECFSYHVTVINGRVTKAQMKIENFGEGGN